MRHFRRHADGFSKGWVRVNRLADIHCVRAHLNRQRNLADHVAGMRADDATAEDLGAAIAMGGVGDSGDDPCIEGDGFVGADLLPLSVRPMACSTSKRSPWFSGPPTLTMQPYQGVVTVSPTDVQTPMRTL